MNNIKNLLKKYRVGWVNSQEPKISFPIATYNRAQILINRTIPSILDQKYKNVEIVIVGDAMSPTEMTTLRGKVKDKRVRVLNLKRRTRYPDDAFSFWCTAGYRPRNIAAKLCKGDWHWWISDDDEISAGAIQKVVDFIKMEPRAESIYGNYIVSDVDDLYTITTKENSKTGLPFDITGMPSWINRSYLSRLFKWDGHSYMNPFNKPSDYDLQHRMYLNHIEFSYLNETLSIVHQALPELGLQGSAAYVSYPEMFR